MATAAAISATLESALRKLRYEESADRKDLEQTLFGLKVVDLKAMCKELRRREKRLAQPTAQQLTGIVLALRSPYLKQ